MTSKAKHSEVDAYVYVKEKLKQLGWDTRNPVKVPGGQIYTQNQCLGEPEIKRWLDKKRPEYIVKVTETMLWVIECKRVRTEIGQALDEAENYYAARLNKSDILKALFVSGLAMTHSTQRVRLIKSTILRSKH